MGWIATVICPAVVEDDVISGGVSVVEPFNEEDSDVQATRMPAILRTDGP